MNECEAKIFQDFMITELEKKEIKDGFAEDFQRYTIDAVNAENAIWDWVKGYYKRNIFRYPLYAQWGWIKEKLGI